MTWVQTSSVSYLIKFPIHWKTQLPLNYTILLPNKTLNYYMQEYHSPVTCQEVNSLAPIKDNKYRNFSNIELGSNKQRKVFD